MSYSYAGMLNYLASSAVNFDIGKEKQLQNTSSSSSD
jgi:hypothetical protein